MKIHFIIFFLTFAVNINLYSQENKSFHSINSIILNGKDLSFGMSSADFITDFPEFKKYDPDEFHILGSDTELQYEVYSYIYRKDINIREFDPFEDMYVIFLKFKDYSLKELEMFSGHSDEGYAIADSILNQFTLLKKEPDDNLEFEKLFYSKGNLEATSYYYETLNLTIKSINQVSSD